MHHTPLPDKTITAFDATYNVYGDCPQCLTERQQRAQTQLAYDRTQALRDRFTRMGIPPRYHGQRVQHFQAHTPAQHSVLEIARRFCALDVARLTDDEATNLPNYDSLLLLGNVGTGKTLLGCGILTDWTHDEDGAFMDSGLYTTAAQLMRRIKMTWRKDADETEQDVLTKLGKPSLLVIDEVGVQFNSDTERCLLTELINDRYNAQQRTILISNLTLKEFTGVVGERIVDRFREGGKVLVFDWQSERGKPTLYPPHAPCNAT